MPKTLNSIIIKGKDWTEINNQYLTLNIFQKLQFNYEYDNLAIELKRDSSKIYASGLVGISRLKFADQFISQNDEYILIIEPRFSNFDPIKMLQDISKDDEFNSYEKKLSSFYHFFFNEKPIKLDSNLTLEINQLNAMLFLTSLRDLLKRPMYGKMLTIEENMASKVKGKIIMHKHIKHNLLQARPDRMYCSYQQFSYDILENQFLKLALYKLKRFMETSNSTLPGINELIGQCWQRMSHISLPTKPIRRQELPIMQGMYSYYNEAFNIANVIDKEISFDFTGTVTQTGYVIPFAINMQNIFEVYARYKVKKYLQQDNRFFLEKFDESRFIFQADEEAKNHGQNVKTSHYISGSVKADLIICQKVNDTNKIVAVLDAKYKDYKNAYLSKREDRLQLLAYGLIYQPKAIGFIFPSMENHTSNSELITGNGMKYLQIEMNGNDKDLINLNFLNEDK